MLALGTTLHDRYRVDRMLEINALGARYRGFDLEQQAQVTISEILPQPGTKADEADVLRKQFETEAQALLNLQHPNVAKVIDYFLHQEASMDPVPGINTNRINQPNAYIISEYIEGNSLSRIIERSGAQPESKVLVWTADLLAALEYCHKHGVFHHDVQPKAVIITPENRAVLVSFEVMGLWKANDPSTWTAKRVMGVPEFASPERWTNRNWRSDPTSDLYSLGATMYTAITGETPTNAGDRMANPYQFLQVKALSPYVSQHTKEIIVKSMSLPQNKRYQSASAMLKDINSPGKPGLASTPAPAPFTPIQRKSFPWMGLLGILFSAVVLFFSGLLGMRLREQWNRTSLPVLDPTPTAQVLSLEAELRSDTPASEDAGANENEVATDSPGATTVVILSTPTALPDINTVLGAEGAQAPAGWNIAIDDTFTDNGYAWIESDYTDDWGAVNRIVARGVYRWELTALQAVSRWCTPDNGTAAADMWVSVSAQLISGPESAAYGLIIRHENGNYYLFNVRNDGFYQFTLWNNFEWIPIIDWTATTAIKPNAVNQISAVADGSHFEFYINDSYIDEADDDRILKGETGLAISTDAWSGDVVYEFDNFVQYTPEVTLIRRSEE